jgi:hypothetical protein
VSSNGNGENVVKNVAMMPGRNGGMLRRGGPIHAGPGRPRSAVRNMLVDEFAAQIPQLKKDLKAGKISRLDFANLCARYGLGTTVTETDTEGHDVIRVIREPRRLHVDD